MNLTKLEEGLNLYKAFKSLQKEKNQANINSSKKSQTRALEIFQFVGYNEIDSNKKITKNVGAIHALNSSEHYNNVPIIGTGHGNLKGIFCTIKEKDLVLVGWLDNKTPIIINSITDIFTQHPDNIPKIKNDEIIIVNKEAGSYIIIKNDNTIKLVNIDGGNLEIDSAGIKASAYKSSDGSLGITQDVALSSGAILHFKDGLLVNIT